MTEKLVAVSAKRAEPVSKAHGRGPWYAHSYDILDCRRVKIFGVYAVPPEAPNFSSGRLRDRSLAGNNLAVSTTGRDGRFG